MAAWWCGLWQLSKGQREPLSRAGNVHLFLAVLGWRMGRRVALRWWIQGQPHVSSQSHLVDRGSLTQSLRVPEEPADSSSTRLCCCPESAAGATGFLCVCLSLYVSSRGTSASCVSLSSWRNMEDLKELEREDAKWTLTGNFVLDKIWIVAEEHINCVKMTWDNSYSPIWGHTT